MGKPGGESQLRRHRCKCENNTEMNLIKIGLGDMNWTNLAQGRDQYRVLVNVVMNFQVKNKIGKFLSSCVIGGFSRRPYLHGVGELLVTQYDI
jgi:hypothetical protein